MDVTTKGVQALVLAAVWLVVILGIRAAGQFLFSRYEQRLAERDGRVAARRRTMFSVLLRVLVAMLVLIGAWSVLSVFPATGAVAGAFLASGAVLALLLGLAVSTPLGNLGSGLLLALTQPVRLGDRITVHMERGDEHTGVVGDIRLSYTTLVTDEGRKIFVPNLTMVRNVLINHSRGDRRRVVSIRLPVTIGAAIDDACRIAAESAHATEAAEELELDLEVHVTEVTETTVWLEIGGFASANADIARIATDIRKRALTALADEGLLLVPERIADLTR
jgi:small-conductance mechanosensitive channel